MADPAEEVKPPPADAVAVGSKKQKFVQVKGEKRQGCPSLVARCLSVVVANLERYPAEMMSMLSEHDWEMILRSRHRKTAPQKGTGGLDGTGRRTPALSERFLKEVETMNPHLAESQVADDLVWKDCVEYQFSRAGLTRPKGLMLPWPYLVKRLEDQAKLLADFRKKEDEADLEDEPLQISDEDEKAIITAVTILKGSPMNLTLLKESGVGKALKKLIKASATRTHKSIFKRIKMPPSSTMAARLTDKDKDVSVFKELDTLLQAWMDLAASKGVDGLQSSKGKNGAVEQFQKMAHDLKLAEECRSWRQLFSVLKGKAEQKREKLGQKMRDNRKRENSLRPQIVKVRPASHKKDSILEKSSASSPTWGRGGGSVQSHGGAKILALRKEAAVQSSREKAGLPTFKKQSGFGQAVAFAAISKPKNQQDRKRKAAPLVSMGNGKRMAVPQRKMRASGANFRKPAKR